MVKENKGNINIIFSEVYEIISHFSDDMISKIPKQFIELIKKNRSPKCFYKYNMDKPLEEQDISEDAKDLISYLYIAYIADNSEELVRICRENDLKNNNL